MKFNTLTKSAYLTPLNDRAEDGSWRFLRRTVRKNGEQALRITLWACSCSSSQAKVTSKKSLSSRSSRKAELMFDSKSFQRKQNFSFDIFFSCLDILSLTLTSHFEGNSFSSL